MSKAPTRYFQPYQLSQIPQSLRFFPWCDLCHDSLIQPHNKKPRGLKPGDLTRSSSWTSNLKCGIKMSSYLPGGFVNWRASCCQVLPALKDPKNSIPYRNEHRNALKKKSSNFPFNKMTSENKTTFQLSSRLSSFYIQTCTLGKHDMTNQTFFMQLVPPWDMI